MAVHDAADTIQIMIIYLTLTLGLMLWLVSNQLTH